MSVSFSPLDAGPSATNAQGIANSFEAPAWYLGRFAANIRVRAETVAALTEGRAFSRVLDIGCGDGSLSLPLLRRSGRVTFLDQSEAMLGRVAARLDERDAPSVEFVNAGFMEAKLPVASFDLVLCVGVLAYVRDPGPFLAKIGDVLQPSGRLILECTEAAHGLSRLERGWQALARLARPAPFSTYPHRRREVIAAAEAQGLRLYSFFKYAYGAPVLSRLVSQPRTYRLIRRLYGEPGRNRLRWLGNQCLFGFERAPAGAPP